MKKYLIISSILLLKVSLYAQDMSYAKVVINRLCNVSMEGRGYVNSGDKRASRYIQKEFAKFNLGAFDTIIDDNGNFAQVYYQNFNFNVITFPKDLIIKFEKDKELIPGEDFFVDPTSGQTILKSFKLVYLTKKELKDEKAYKEFLSMDFSEKCVVIDKEGLKKYKDNEYYSRVIKNGMNAGAIIFLQSEKLSWSVGIVPKKYPILHVKKDKFPKKAERVEIKIDRDVLPMYESQNVLGFVKGKKYPDNYILVTTHYDYLGKMGENVRFSGANDNASGVAMMLNLAKFFSKPGNQPDMSIAFLAFAGTNAGNIGAKYYTMHPLFPLRKIRVVLNLHKMGTGDRGLEVYHNNKIEFDKLQKINNSNNYFPEVKTYRISKKSDQFYFHKKMIKSLTLSLRGDYPNSFDLNDTPDNLSLVGFIRAYRLLVNLIKDYQK